MATDLLDPTNAQPEQPDCLRDATMVAISTLKLSYPSFQQIKRPGALMSKVRFRRSAHLWMMMNERSIIQIKIEFGR